MFAIDRTASRPFARTAVGGAVLLAALGLQPSTAAAGAVCEASLPGSTCRIAVQPGLTLETTVAGMTEVSGTRYELEGTVTVVAPGGVRIPLQRSELIVDLGDAPEIYGTSEVPLDRMPVLSEADFETIPRAAIGLAQGDTVEELVGADYPLPLNRGRGADGRGRDANRPYLLFHLDAGIAFRLPMQAPLNEVEFTVPGSMSATAVLDLAEPYAYLAYSKTDGIDLNRLKRKSSSDSATAVYEIRDEAGEKVVMTFTLDTAAGTLVERNLVAGTTVTYRRNADGDYVHKSASGATATLQGGQFESLDRDRRREEGKSGDADKKKRKDRPEGAGTPIDAFAFSLNGWVPFVAADPAGMPKGIAGFAGQTYLHGEIPLSPAVSVQGDVVTYVGQNGYAQGGNGTVLLSIPGLPDFIDFDIELGNASAAVRASATDQKVFVAGEFKPDVDFLADFLPIMPKAGARVEGYVGNDLLNTYLEIDGEVGIDAARLGELVGLDMNELAMTKASFIIDRHGFEVTGSTRLQISPDIDIQGEVEVYASMTWNDPADLSLSISGDMNLYGVALEDVTLELDGRGLFARGAFVTPISRIALDGRITSAGPQMSGSGTLDIDMAKVTAGMGRAHAALTAAQAEVAKLDRQIEAARDQVNAERARHRAERDRARAALTAAQGKVDGLNASIRKEERAIADHKSRISAKYRWYRAGNAFQRPGRYASYTAEKAWRTAAIGRHYATIGGLRTALAAAKGALELAKKAYDLIDAATVVTPVDADPRVAGLITARGTALAALEAAKAPFAAFPSLSGTVSADLAVTLGTSGVAGTVSLGANGKTVRGTVSFAPRPKVCLDVPVAGEVCVAL